MSKHRRPARTALRTALLVLSGAVALIVVLVVVFKDQAAAYLLVSTIERSTGMPARVDGQVDTTLFSTEPGLTVTQLTVGPVTETAESVPLRIGRLAVQIDLAESIAGQMTISRMEVSDVTLNPSDFAGRRSSGPAASGNAWLESMPVVDELVLRDIRLRHPDPDSTSVQHLVVKNLDGAIDPHGQSRADLAGQIAVTGTDAAEAVVPGDFQASVDVRLSSPAKGAITGTIGKAPLAKFLLQPIGPGRNDADLADREPARWQARSSPGRQHSGQTLGVDGLGIGAALRRFPVDPDRPSRSGDLRDAGRRWPSGCFVGTGRSTRIRVGCCFPAMLQQRIGAPRRDRSRSRQS
ncbi:MAG: hypothetical protein R3E68_09695 [Burkholderiaceae bacterium]